MNRLSQEVKLALAIDMLDVILQVSNDPQALFVANLALSKMGDSYVPDKDDYYFLPWYDDSFDLPRC